MAISGYTPGSCLLCVVGDRNGPIFPYFQDRSTGTGAIIMSNGIFTDMELTLILTWISNHRPINVYDEITYPFPNFHGHFGMDR